MQLNYYKEPFEKFLTTYEEVGYVEILSYPVIYASGLPNVKVREVVMFDDGSLGYVTSLDKEYVEILLFSKDGLRIGSKIARTGNVLEIPVGEELLGTSITPLGFSIYEGYPAKRKADFRPIDIHALDISYREKITEPVETGVALVDLLIPLGKGQREMIVGDRKTGKTEFLLQTMLSQAKKGTICIYAAIGKKKIDIKKVENFFVRNGIIENSIIVATSSSDALGLVYLTPYSAMSIAEYFRDLGRDVLLILDDMSTHAKFYREISLLSKRFPGRSSYPGDIFYTHSRLLERAGNFKHPSGKPVSITCLPVAESIEGDISGYIQTNLMSITDGHVYFDKDLFANGRRPAINYFLSVTRVGRQTQSQIRWGVNRELNSFLTLLEKTQSFIHFGAELNEGIRSTLSMGEHVLAFFDQPMDKVIPINMQIVLFGMIWLGFFKSETNERIQFITQLSIEKYRSDQKFKEKIDKLISDSTDFNNLLGSLSIKKDEILSFYQL